MEFVPSWGTNLTAEYESYWGNVKSRDKRWAIRLGIAAQNIQNYCLHCHLKWRHMKCLHFLLDLRTKLGFHCAAFTQTLTKSQHLERRCPKSSVHKPHAANNAVLIPTCEWFHWIWTWLFSRTEVKDFGAHLESGETKALMMQRKVGPFYTSTYISTKK